VLGEKTKQGKKQRRTGAVTFGGALRVNPSEDMTFREQKCYTKVWNGQENMLETEEVANSGALRKDHSWHIWEKARLLAGSVMVRI
jgi:hypothetical protein